MVRQRVAARLEATIAEGHDPMTLVAQGAALYGRPRASTVAPPRSRCPPGARSGSSIGVSAI